MKLAVLGGGGVRSPFLAKYIASRGKSLNINEVVFMDNDAEKLKIFGGLSKKIAAIVDEELKFTITTDAVEAVKDADFIITSLRVGQDVSRVIDERGALDEGVVGQETTGAGGFAMALRSIPTLIEYCKLASQYSKPGVHIFNFTNPSGLVTQALRNEGFHNVYGICDGPNGFFKEVSQMLDISQKSMSIECFGLNHLSWFRSVKIDGVEKVDELIYHPELYTKTEAKVFDPDLVKRLGMLPNAYLYYYYHRERAVETLTSSEKTRGESIAQINKDMLKELSSMDIEKDYEKMLKIYLKYYTIREKSYMAIEAGNTGQTLKEEDFDIDIFQNDYGAGYAGVALNFIEAITTGREKEMILSIPNKGMIEGLQEDDVVEITCKVGKNGVKPLYIGKVPELQMTLMRQVKLFERLTVDAIKNKSINTAIDALMIHPLINSYSLAKKLVHTYLKDYQNYVGVWR